MENFYPALILRKKLLGALEEAYLFQQTLRTEGAQRNMRRALEVGLQTREGESKMGQLALDFIEATY